jgi:epoxyqueuosine reductase
MLPNDLVFDFNTLKTQALAMGFNEVSVADFTSLPQAREKLALWLANGNHASMDYMARNAALRADPALLLPQARSALLLRMNYLPDPTAQVLATQAREQDVNAAQVSLYAQGRDYHRVLRSKLAKLADTLALQYPNHGFRAFTDSAPVMEVELAQASGLGWRGKHTLLLNREAGSFFFLGGILTTLALSPTAQISPHCGQCEACLTVCPTQAITAPYRVDARRCISYLTIEHEGAIDAALRPLMGNRIYGCDDCQTACPWNKFAQASAVADFAPRNGLDTANLLDLWVWTEAQFLERTQGSAIRRIGHARWLRNIATALGNALRGGASNAAHIRNALATQVNHIDPAVREHVAWALSQ